MTTPTLLIRALDVIAKKRDAQTLTDGEIAAFVSGYVSGEIPDYQAAAFCMAVYCRGMNAAETAALTRAMALSGETLDLAGAGLNPARTIDKHSTGGVGDKASLIVVPILAAAGAFVCKMSGRGLGHTGGTLDKLESIPGFRTRLGAAEMVAQVKRVGACLAGQTAALAPADGKLYALRDATATVGSLPLIVSSILSKKLAGGARNLLFDVKVGDGAILQTDAEARQLADALLAGAAADGRRAVAVLSDMDAPLGWAVGNALEVREAIAALTPGASGGDARLRDVCLALAGEGIALCGIRPTAGEGRAFAAALIAGGAALAKLGEIVAAQGGDPRVVTESDLVLAPAPVRLAVTAARGGTVERIAPREVGEIVVSLGGGRARKDDTVDPAVGVVFSVTVGSAVFTGAVLAEVHAADADAARAAAVRLAAAVRISDAPQHPTPVIRDTIYSHPTPGVRSV